MKTTEQVEQERMNDVDWVTRLDNYVEFIKKNYTSSDRRLFELKKAYLIDDEEKFKEIYGI